MQFIDLAAQYARLKEDIDQRIHAVLDHGKYIGGPEILELEDQLSAFTGRKHAITCANGTDALRLALMALGVGPGDGVFVPAFTFVATAEAVSLLGATPIFVDVEIETFNISAASLEDSVNSAESSGALRLKAVIAVDLFGQPANFEAIEPIVQKHDLFLVEDAAQSFGSQISGKTACSFGHVAMTSFFPAKPLGCYGDGGAIFTDDDELAGVLRSMCVHGKGSNKYDNIRIGMNSRLDTIQAAVLLSKLTVLADELERRNRIAQRYNELLSKNYSIPVVRDGFTSSWALYTLQSSSRDHIVDGIRSEGIPAAIYYPTCLHQQKAYSALNVSNGELRNSERLSSRVFSIPMHPYLTADEIETICEGVIAKKQH